ncbi:MAG: ABC transporter permease [Dysgonamonadaceae bacterium]|jgi:ABC-2 type transport system permease protein|nr:ABC transporter permease [Dysgonamonadaceae bacterium]
MLQYLIQKEFRQIFRNAFIPKILVVLPLMVILVFPWAANQEITHIRVNIVDGDHSPYSRRLTDKIAASPYFELIAVSSTHDEATAMMEDGQVDLILEIEPDFEKHGVTQNPAALHIAANAVNIMKGGLGANYMGQIIRNFMEEIQAETVPGQTNPGLPVIRITSQNRFNPHGDYKIFMIPALLVMLLTIICGFLPTLNIVSEKEKGTIEQINVTPVKKTMFILGKLIPNWMMGLVIMSVYLGLAALVYGLVPAGNILAVYGFAVLYILVVSGIGLIISNYSSTTQQAMFTMFFFMIIMILLSGLFTPIASMPAWAQTMTLFNPLRYFAEIMRMIYLKGSSIWELGGPFFALTIMACVFNIWAILAYRKSQ